MVTLVEKSRLSPNDKQDVLDLINDINELRSVLNCPITMEYFSDNMSHFRTIIKKNRSQYWTMGKISETSYNLMQLYSESPTNHSINTRLPDLFHSVAHTFPQDFKNMMYRYMRDLIANRRYIESNAPVTVKYVIENKKKFHAHMRFTRPNLWSEDALKKCYSCLLEMINYTDDPPTITNTPAPTFTWNTPTTTAPNAPEAQEAQEAPAAPKKAKRKLFHDSINKGHVKQALIKKLEMFLDVLDYDSTNFYVSFEYDNRCITLQMSDVEK